MEKDKDITSVGLDIDKKGYNLYTAILSTDWYKIKEITHKKVTVLKRKIIIGK